MAEVPKRIANKRDKDQMRVWSDDQHPPIIKDYDAEIKSLRDLIMLIGETATNTSREVERREKTWSLVLHFEIRLKYAYTTVDPSGNDAVFEGYSWAGGDLVEYEIDPTDSTAVEFPVIFGAPVDHEVTWLIDQWTQRAACQIGTPEFQEATMVLQTEIWHQDPIVHWTETVSPEHEAPYRDLWQIIGDKLGFGIYPQSFSIFPCVNDSSDPSDYTLRGTFLFTHAKGVQSGSDLPTLDPDYHALVTLRGRVGITFPIEAIEYEDHYDTE